MSALAFASLFFVYFAIVAIMLVASALGYGVDLGSLQFKDCSSDTSEQRCIRGILVIFKDSSQRY